MKSIIAEIFSLVSAYHQQSEYAAGFQAALNDAAHYILTHHNQPMDKTLWLANTYNRVHFRDGLLAAIENQWTDIRRIQWDLACMTSPILDEQYQTAKDVVFTFFVETTLSINGALKCPAKTEFASTGISAPISGEVRMDTLYPATNNASVREISWDTLERGGRIYKNYCEQSAVEMIDTSLQDSTEQPVGTVVVFLHVQ